MLGIRYITAAGYDPAGGATMLAALTRTTALESARSRADQPLRRRNGPAPIR